MLDNDKQLINFIKEKSNNIAKRLNLRPPKIDIKKYYENCSTWERGNNIIFGLIFIRELKFKNLHTEAIPPDTFLNRVYFVIAHELGHIFQFTKHQKWHTKYSKDQFYNKGIVAEEYVKQKLEKNASKIANILLREYKKRNENVRKI